MVMEMNGCGYDAGYLKRCLLREKNERVTDCPDNSVEKLIHPPSSALLTYT